MNPRPLHANPLAAPVEAPSFAQQLAGRGLSMPRRRSIQTLQVNLGKLCNQACLHCHVDAGPGRREIMQGPVAERVMDWLTRNPSIEVLDLTGGAPELNAHFRPLVRHARKLGRKVIDRCNLTVFFEAGQETLPQFLAAEGVHVTASLPCYSEERVNAQRGDGVFEKSVRAIRVLNELGYAVPGSGLELSLVFNPGGANLPPPQADLEASYREELLNAHGIRFSHLLVMTNLPVRRFATALERQGKLQEYMQLLIENFNPSTLPELMCTQMLSVAWNGTLHDCDFNQMLDMPLSVEGARTIFDVDGPGDLVDRPVRTAAHCLGCTAGAGSSCGGSLA